MDIRDNDVVEISLTEAEFTSLSYDVLKILGLHRGMPTDEGFAFRMPWLKAKELLRHLRHM